MTTSLNFAGPTTHIDVPHQARQIRRQGVQHKMVMVAHQAVSQHLRIKAPCPLGHHLQPSLLIHTILKDRLPTITTRRHVLSGTGTFNAKRAGHEGLAWDGGFQGLYISDLTLKLRMRATCERPQKQRQRSGPCSGARYPIWESAHGELGAVPKNSPRCTEARASCSN